MPRGGCSRPESSWNRSCRSRPIPPLASTGYAYLGRRCK
eukprot:gene26866-biopygen17450